MKNSLKNILLITPGFPENENDTTCIPALQDFVRGINCYQPDISVTIISLHYPSKPSNYQWLGNEVYAIGANNSKFPKRFLFWKKLKSMIKSLHQEKSFDVIHTFWYDEVTYVSSKTAKELGVPLFCTFMGQDAIGENRYVHKINMSTEHLVAISPFQQNQIYTRLNFRINHVIPWGLMEKSLPTSKKDFDVVNVGSFNNVKNQIESVYILQNLQKLYPSMKCAFIGDGPELNSVKRLVVSMGLESNIVFLGSLCRKETLETIAKSKILLHSSNYESFGMIFAEAILGKTMIVSKNVGIASDKEWWKIYRDQADATEKIGALLSHPCYPDKQDAEEFSLRSTVNKYMKLWSTKKGRT